MERDVMTICNGYYGSLVDANNELKGDPALKKSTNAHLDAIGKTFKGTVNVRHIIELLYDEPGPEKIKEMVTRPLDLRVTRHYGCHLVKPSKERKLGSTEDPRFFDELVEATGAESVNYPDRMACYGAGGGVRSALLDKSLEMLEHKLSRIRDADVDRIMNACPFCHLQFDGGQVEIEKKNGVVYNIPVLHYSQLLGLAFGYLPEELGIDLNLVTNEEFLLKLEEDCR